jgi:ABC-type multidrug transport system fused ATPase/permease subunit
MMQSLRGLTEVRTVLLITHHLVDLHRLDKIVMLEDGRIVEQGPHESLLALDGRYAALLARMY